MTRGSPVLVPERDLKGATPETLARALLRNENLCPRRVVKSVVRDQVTIEEIATDESGDGVPHLNDSV